MHFCHLRKMHHNPTLHMDTSEIPVLKSTNSSVLFFIKSYLSFHTLNINKTIAEII